MRNRLIVILLVVATGLIGAKAKEQIRVLLPAMAGSFYPADKDELKKSIEKCCEPAEVLSTPPPGHIAAIVVPHASIQMSGNIAGAAFRLINKEDYDRVIVISPSHYAGFRGCSIPAVQVCRTPLGDIPLDGPTIGKLDLSALIDLHAVNYSNHSPERLMIHEKEYSLEAILPFLQVRLGEFKIIPILTGTFLDMQDKPDQYALNSVAETIKTYVTEKTLIVISSDFTHYGNRFRNTPFTDNIEDGIEKLDREAIGLVLDRDFNGFLEYIERTENSICGVDALALLIKLLPKNAEGTLLQYDTSSHKTGKTDSSISFASIVFTVPADKTPITSTPLPQPSAHQEKHP